MRDVQRRILAGAPEANVKRPSELLVQIRNALYRAVSEERLVPKGDLAQIVQLTQDKHDSSKFVLTGGIKDFRRDEANARLIRDDLAWFHFTITLQAPREGSVEVLGYDFEIVFPRSHQPPWIRFDYNLPGTDNEARNIRSHVHPGSDDLQLPAPILRPIELVELYVNHLRPRDPENQRL